MKIAILSDIHANYAALQAVLTDIDADCVDEIISLGDNIGYGPQPAEVIKTLREREIPSVLGNHEHAINRQHYFWRVNPSVQQSLEITTKLLSKKDLAYCAALPNFILHCGCRFVHGCPPESVITYLWNPSRVRMQRLFYSFPEQICFFGHTHILSCYIKKEEEYIKPEVSLGPLELHPGCRYMINPGSVGQPRDDIDRRAKYGVLDTEQQTFTYKAVAYDVAATIQLLEERGFPITNALRLQ